MLVPQPQPPRATHLGIADSDAPLVIWRNVAFHAGATIVLLVTSAVVVNRRRPD